MDYLGFAISNSVTQEEWEKLYEETLFMADKLNLADWNKFYYKGIRSYAFCKVKEQKKKDFDKTIYYWKANSDYKFTIIGEPFRLDRKLKVQKYNKDAGPAILSRVEPYLRNISSTLHSDQATVMENIEICNGAFYIRILAILCFLEDKLKEKIFIFGNLDLEACKMAIKIANEILKEPIDLPARCDYNRLYEIVKTLQITDVEKILLMEKVFLGDIDLEYKEFIEKQFDKTVINQFWKKRFQDCDKDSYEFKELLKTYFSYGFDIKELFSYISFTNKNEELLKLLKFTIKAGYNTDRIFRRIGLTKRPDNDRVIGFSRQFIHSLFGSDSTITIENYTFSDLINEFSKYFGNKDSIKKILEENIKIEDEDEFITRVRKILNDDNSFQEDEKYDIYHHGFIMDFKPGDTFSPYLMDEIKKTVKVCRERLTDEDFKELENKEIPEQIFELIDLNPHFPVRDTDWIHAIDYFYTHTDALKRYYPLFCLRYEFLSATPHIAKAIFLNDDFYEFCKNL